MLRFHACLFGCLASGIVANAGLAQSSEISPAELHQLLEDNRALQQRVEAQQRTIEELKSEVSDIRRASERHERQLAGVSDQPAASTAPRSDAAEVRITGETGLAFFSSGPSGAFPHSEFRIDDAKIYIEARVWKDVYFTAGLELFTREASDESTHLGEIYVDVENLFRARLPDGLLNLRAGRFNIPFGEEYQQRDPVGNPLISHSESDVWGEDEGLAIFGSSGAWQYIVAVQNGGNHLLHDSDADKAVIARLGYDPRPWLHLSGSAMRTGDLNAVGDSVSAVWIGNGFFHAINPSAVTFAADLFEVDADLHWKSGSVRLNDGYARFVDNRPGDQRILHFATAEVVQSLTEQFYTAARYSLIRAGAGYPLVGQGDFGTYEYRSGGTRDLHRFSLGLGYRIGPPLVFKVEYSWEDGRLVSGASRNQEDLLSTELALKF